MKTEKTINLTAYKVEYPGQGGIHGRVPTQHKRLQTQ